MKHFIVVCLVVAAIAPALLAETDESQEDRIHRLEAENKALRATIRQLVEGNEALKAEIKALKEGSASEETSEKSSPEETKTEKEQSGPALKPLKEFEEALALGQAASVRGAKVFQVQGPKDTLAELPVAYYYLNIPVSPGGEVKGEFSLKAKSKDYKEVLVWIRGIDTAGMVDGQSARIDKVLKVSGTKAYETSAGQRTVFLLEPTTDEETAVVEREIQRLERIERAKKR